jgi:hypothetical protein
MTMTITNLTNQDYWFGPLHLPANGSLPVDDTSATSLYLTDDAVADAINTLWSATPAKIQVTGYALPFPRPTGEPTILHGDGSPEGIVYSGQGSLYLRRDGAASVYQKSTGIHLNTGWILQASTGGKITSSLFSGGPPANPNDGDIWIALAVDTGDLSTTNGTVWQFRYNAYSVSTYKWEFIGGSPFLSTGWSGTTSLTSWQACTGGTSYTMIHAGDYLVRLGGLAASAAQSGEACEISINQGILPAQGPSNGNSASIETEGRQAFGVSTVVLPYILDTNGNSSVSLSNGYFELTPIRIT